MTWDFVVIAYVGAFLGVLLLIEGLAQLLGLRVSAAEQAVNRRLRMLAKGADSEEVYRLLRRDQRRWGYLRVPGFGDLQTLFDRSGVNIKPVTYLLGSAAVGVLMYVLADWRAGWQVALGIGVLFGVVLPMAVLIFLAVRRARQLTQQLPDVIDLMVRSLQAGHPLSMAIQTVAHQLADPIGTEMGIVSDEITYGEELSDAIRSLANRSGSEDFQYLAVAISIQHGTGGNLAAVLTTLSQVVRDRFTMQRKIRAVSAEGRTTAYVVTSVPIVLVVFLLVMMPGFYTEVANDPLFWPFMYAGAGLSIANAIVLNRLVRFRF